MELKASIHFKDQWIDVHTGDMIRTEYSTETIYGSCEEELSSNVKDLIVQRRGSDVYNGVRHKVEVLSVDGVENAIPYKLTKEEMFDFILSNRVTIIHDGSIWTTVDGLKVRKNYTVSINDCGMQGMNLEEAIQYYYDKLRSRGK